MHTGVVRSTPSGTDVPPTVAVVSDRSLVAEAVATALVGSNLAIVRNVWPSANRAPQPRWPGDAAPSLGLLLCDLEPPTTRTARWVVCSYPTRWLLLTDRPKGPQWGAMLEVGVVGILPNHTTLSDLLVTIEALHRGHPSLVPPDRDELIQAWLHAEAEREMVHARMGGLTARETEVLRQLHRGLSVHEIADRRGVAHSTVRTQVRSVLRKLGVTSQLAAAAMLEKWGCP